MRKVRIISFRMTEEEYECLRQHSLRYGATSVSEFARLLAGTATAAAAGSDMLAEAGLVSILNNLKHKIQSLDARLNSLSTVVDNLQKTMPSAASRSGERDTPIS